MPDRHACHVFADVKHQGWKERVRRTDGEHSVHHGPADQPEGRQTQAAGLANHDLVEPGLHAAGNAPEQVMFLSFELADDDVVMGMRQKGRDVGWVVLQVIIHGDDHLAARFTEATQGGRLLPEVARELHAPDTGPLPGHALDGRPDTSIGRSVVDQNDLEWIGAIREYTLDPADESIEIRGVENRNYDRHEPAGIDGHPHARSVTYAHARYTALPAMPKRVAILQSNYIPWKGYFDLIADADEFIFLDDVQYTRQNWRNRNRIKTSRGAIWLTIPVGTSIDRRICDVTLPPRWADAHWRQLVTWYSQAPHFETYRPLLEEVYLARQWPTLTELNQHMIRMIAGLLGITTRFRDSREFGVTTGKEDRVLELLAAVGAGVYISGPAARAYIDERRFEAAGHPVIWKDYSGYPEYPQFHPPFDHSVTILDLLFHTGPNAPHYIWGWRGAPG
jgi:hypothetical protein